MNDTRIYLILYKDEDLGKTYVSHGIGNNTLKNYCLPPEPLSYFLPYYTDSEISEHYIIND